MPAKLPEEKKAKQTAIRFRPEDRERINIVASRLHRRGVPGMLTPEGEPIAAHVIRYLLKEAAEQEQDKKEVESE
jgi:hypothetical protein